jgi:hypothetical protein
MGDGGTSLPQPAGGKVAEQCQRQLAANSSKGVPVEKKKRRPPMEVAQEI